MQADPIGYEGGMNMYAYCGNSPIGRTDPSGLEWLDKEGGLWGQDYAMSCTAASLVNMVWELFYQYGDEIAKKYPNRDPWVPWEEDDFREVLDGGKGSDEFWNMEGIFLMSTIRTALNNYLDTVDPNREVLPRYIVKNDWKKSSNDILSRVKHIGPIMFIENVGGEEWSDPKFVPPPGSETIATGTLHACTLLGTHSEGWLDTTYRYWDPMWNYPSVGLYDKDTMEYHWTALDSYNNSVLVPIKKGEDEYLTIDR